MVQDSKSTYCLDTIVMINYFYCYDFDAAMTSQVTLHEYLYV